MPADRTPTVSRQPIPTHAGQFTARPTYRNAGLNRFPAMILTTATLWAAMLWMTMTPIKLNWHNTLTHTPLPIAYYTHNPSFQIAVIRGENNVSPPSTSIRQTTQQDLLTLGNHVGRTLLKDEFDTLVLRLSLGQQVVGHLVTDVRQALQQR